MYRISHQHDDRAADIGVPAVIFYEETAWQNFLEICQFWRKTTNIYILENCKFTSVPNEPFTRDSAKITIDGQDIFEMLADLGMKGVFKIRCSAARTNGHGYVKDGRIYAKDADCRLRIGFTDKKSAMMAKLKWGGSKLTW